MNASAGIILHYPAAQTWRTLSGLVEFVEGKTDNPAALLFGPPRRSKATPFGDDVRGHDPMMVLS